MAFIKSITAHQILDSRGNPTVEAVLSLGDGHSFSASVPSGKSRGRYEAVELRDGGKRWNGLGVQNAVNNIGALIQKKLKGKNPTDQEEIDRLLTQLDGTKNKSRLGANAMLAVSLACARAGAASQKKELFQYLNALLKPKRKMVLPRPYMNVINGGKHADNRLSFQEFMIVPRMKSLAEALRAGSEVYQMLKKELHARYGKGSTNIGDEGGFAPEQLQNTETTLIMLITAITDAGYKRKVDIAIDCAASEFFKNENYLVDGKKVTSEQLMQFYLLLLKKYPIISLEDPFEQNDFASFAELKRKTKIQIVGDDLTATNVERIKKAIRYKSCNALLLKPNQIGTLTEALDAAQLAFANSWNVMASHRSGETNDTFIADLAVGLGCGMIKAGAPCRGERVAKYNRLLEIERMLK